MSSDDTLCACGHRHLTVRGPCTGWDICGCRTHRSNLDPPEQVIRRRRELIEALDACRHDIRGLRDGVTRTRARRNTRKG